MTPLLDRFRDRAARAGGRVSAVVLDPDGREVLALAPDEPMFAASVIKLPIVMTLYEDAHDGRIDLEEQVPAGTRLGGTGVLRHLADVERVSLRDLASLTIAVSDNTATNRLIDRIGIDRVNERLDEWGCPVTRLRRLLFDWEARSRGLENLMTAREAAALLRRVATGASAGAGGSRDVLALLGQNLDLTRLGRYLPRGVSLAHKDGWGHDPDPVENDAGLIRGSREEGASRSAIAAGFTHNVEMREAWSLLGLLGLVAAETAGIELGALPSEVSGAA